MTILLVIYTLQIKERFLSSSFLIVRIDHFMVKSFYEVGRIEGTFPILSSISDGVESGTTSFDCTFPLLFNLPTELSFVDP
mmetsp:Transcript_29909/g.32584  ORF Transcript_29909/g.32584 Transcript_29909/m.32584 type:complete len:81 (-) Transcript_29909:155-397(-)